MEVNAAERETVLEGEQPQMAGSGFVKKGRCTIELSTVDSAKQLKGKPIVELVDPLKAVRRGADLTGAWDNFREW